MRRVACLSVVFNGILGLTVVAVAQSPTPTTAVPAQPDHSRADPFAHSSDPFAHSSDPFAQSASRHGSKADPFARGANNQGKPAADPFGDQAGNDPFDRPTGSDPFGGQAGDDPFGNDPFAQDPVVGNAVTARPDSRRPRSTDEKRADDEPTAQQRARIAETFGVSPDSVEARFLAVLDQAVSFDFQEIPLEDAVRVISTDVEIPLVIDRRALDETGITTDEPVELHVRKVKLRSLLNLMLSSLELNFTIRDEVILITSQAEAEQNLKVRMYKVPDAIRNETKQLTEAIQASVSPQSWEVRGGLCTVSVIDRILVVAANDDVHYGVVDFMRKFDHALNRASLGQ